MESAPDTLSTGAEHVTKHRDGTLHIACFWMAEPQGPNTADIVGSLPVREVRLADTWRDAGPGEDVGPEE